MTIPDLLHKHPSKAQALEIAAYISAYPDQMEVLWKAIQEESPKIAGRASWIFEITTTKSPELLPPYLPRLIPFLLQHRNSTIMRNLTRAISTIQLPEEYHGEVYSQCIEWLLDPEIPVAVKAHSMTLAAGIAHKIPELKEELIMVLRDQTEFNSVAFGARAKHIIKKLRTTNYE